MKVFLVIVIFTVFSGQIFARPNNVEVEQHHVVDISRNFNITAMNSTAKIDETRRILKEIDRINQSLGYTKRNPSRTASVFDSQRLSESLFYPKTPFHPPGMGRDIRSSAIVDKISDHESDIRQRVKWKQEPEARGFLMIPLNPTLIAITDNPWRFTPFFPQLTARTARLSKKWNKKPHKKKTEYEKTEPPPILKQNSLFDALIDEMVDDDDDEDDEYEQSKDDGTSVNLPSIDNDEYINSWYKTIMKSSNKKRDLEKEPKLPFSTTTTTTTKKPKPSTTPPNKAKTTTKKPPTKKPDPLKDENSKSPFGALFRPAAQAGELLKEAGGGIIIQRLKVRKGGIAIAGPGGVATAGSGGTAIVGPGGIAFTHPRGLAIAGPGAKVYSVPENTDLESVPINATAREFPFPTEIVATGPIVYYNPGR